MYHPPFLLDFYFLLIPICKQRQHVLFNEKEILAIVGLADKIKADMQNVIEKIKEKGQAELTACPF